MKKNTTIGLKELRENMETYIKKVEQGERINVVRRSKPLFTITPWDDEESNWETVIDFPKELGRSVPFDEVLDALKTLRGQDSKTS